MKTLKTLLVAAAISAITTAAAHADALGDASISVKFNDTSNPHISASSQVGVVASKNFNIESAASGTAISLSQDISGAVTPGTAASLTYSAGVAGAGGAAYGQPDGFGFGAGNANTGLILDGLSANVAGGDTVSLSGLGTAYTGGYDLYLYSTSSYNGPTVTFALTDGTFTGTKTLANSGDSSFYGNTGFQAGDNYVEFSGLTASSLSLLVTGSGSATEAFSGFQIVADPVAAPEPATYAALFGGLLMLGLVLRRRSSLV